jgi:hypothetical protein
MKVLIYYSTELATRSSRPEKLVEAFEENGHSCFAYWHMQGPVGNIPFTPDVIITRLSHTAIEDDYKNLQGFSGIPVTQASEMENISRLVMNNGTGNCRNRSSVRTGGLFSL